MLPHTSETAFRPRIAFPLAAALLFVFAIPDLVACSRDVDVLLYMAAAARANDAGALPYVAAWIEKGPLAMGLFQGIAAVFGRYDFAGQALVWAGFALAGAWSSRSLARAAGATWGAGWAPLLFAAGIGAVGGSLNTEIPAMALGSAAVAVWFRSLARGELAGRLGLSAGLLVGAAFLCRQNAGALLAILAGLELALRLRKGRSGGETVRAIAGLGAGFAAPVAATLAAYAAAGALPAFRFCFWEYNASIYIAATKIDAARMLRIPWDVIGSFLAPTATTAALAIGGAVASVRAVRGRRVSAGSPQVVAVSLVLIATGMLAAIVPGLRFFSHYAALSFPFLAALGALGLEAIVVRAGRHATLAVSLVALLLGLELTGRGWLDTAARLERWAASTGAEHPLDPIAWPGNDETAVEVARFVRAHGAVSDTIFVWGMKPHVPVYADRLPATRFVTCTFLTGLVPWERVGSEEDTSRWIVPGAWDLLVSDLERERPEWIVDASYDHMFADGAYRTERFPVLQGILDRGYDRVFETGSRDRMIVYRRR
jgi:hypothetical protein